MRKYFCLFLVLCFLGCKKHSEENINDMTYSKIEKLSKISELSSLGKLDNADLVAKYLSDDDSEVVGAACVAIGILGARNYIPNLIELLEKKDERIVNMAISGLSYMVDERDVYLLDRLYEIMESDSALANLSAIEAIGNIRNRSSADRLIRHFTTKKDLAVRIRIIDSLGKIKNPVALPLLKEYLREVDGMDHSQPNRGGVRGSEPHPDALEIITRQAIAEIEKDDASSANVR